MTDSTGVMAGGQPPPDEAPWQWLAIACLALPWLWPWARGPWPTAVPWLVSLACMCLLLLVTGGRRVRMAEAMAWAWVGAASASGAIGMLQYLGVSEAFQPWINVTSPGEAFGNLRQRNQFATLTNVGLAALLLGPVARSAITAAWASIDDPRALVTRWWALAAVTLMAAGNAASRSRTGLLQLALLAVLALLWNGWRDRATRALLVVAVLSYVLAAIALPMLVGMDPVANSIGARFRDESMPCGSRITMWGNVAYLIVQKPLGGWGWGELDYAHFMAEYPGTRFCEILDNAHNLPLHLAVELGLPLALLVCLVAMLLVWRARPWREAAPVRQLSWAALALILLHSLLEYPLWYGPFQMAAAISIWLLWDSQRREGAGVMPALRVAARAAALLGLVGVAYALWDYHRVGQLYLATSDRDPAYRINTLQKVSDSWLFARQVKFAELTTTDVTEGNAQRIHAMAQELLHFSPEPRVVEKLIESAALLGRDDEVRLYQARFKAAFPLAYANWLKSWSQP